MRYLIVPIALLLAGCAHDNYAQSGDARLMSKALYNCKVAAATNSNRDHAAAVGGMVAGAAAGLLVGIAASPEDSLNRKVEKCMAEHGYIGTSN